MTKRTLSLVFALGLAMGVALSTSRAEAGPRPGSDLDLLTRLNGSQTRELNTLACTGHADGGGLTLWTADAGIGCNCVKTGAVYEMNCDVGVYFCPWGDGGCSTVIGHQNFGKPVKASTVSAPAPFYFVVPASSTADTQYVCMTQATQAVAICALHKLQ